MEWTLLLAIGFVAGFYFGVALMGLMQLSSRRKKQEAFWVANRYGSPLEGPSTIS